jgi:tetratricopeptide (TPR) repeat protein
MRRSLIFYIGLAVVAILVLHFPVFPQASRPNLEQANRAYQQKDWREAAAAYESITSAGPSNSFAWLHLGISRHKLGQYEQAVAAYKHIENDPQFGAPALYREAASLAKLNRTTEALTLLDKAVENGFARPEIIQQDPDLAVLHADSGFSKIVDKADAMAHPCAHQPEYRQFDFWIGDWDVVATQGHDPAGTSSIQLILDKCVLLENWTGGSSGKSFNHYDTTTKKWIQDWVDNQSNSVHFEGNLENGVMSFYADSLNPDGTHARRHLQFFKLDDDHVRQFSQQSTDGGKTWTVEYDLTYNRKK